MRKGNAERAALRLIVKVLTEFLDYDEAIARGSYREWTGRDWLWNDDVWRRGDTENWKQHARARRAIAAGKAALSPSHPTPGPVGR